MLDVDTADRAGDAGIGNGLLLRAALRLELGARLGGHFLGAVEVDLLRPLDRVHQHERLAVLHLEHALGHGAEVVPSLEEAFRTLADTDTVFVIGGGEIYRQALPSADVVWLTKIDADFEGDTTFPELPESEWTTEVLEMLEPTESRSFEVTFCRCERRA